MTKGKWKREQDWAIVSMLQLEMLTNSALSKGLSHHMFSLRLKAYAALTKPLISRKNEAGLKIGERLNPDLCLAVSEEWRRCHGLGHVFCSRSWTSY